MNVRQLRWLMFVLDAAERWVDEDESPAHDRWGCPIRWRTQAKRRQSRSIKSCWKTYEFVRLQMHLERKWRELGIVFGPSENIPA